MTTRQPKRKQQPNGTGCPVSRKKQKNGFKPEVKKQHTTGHGKRMAQTTAHAIKKRKANGDAGKEQKSGIKYAENFRTKLQSGLMAMSAIRHFLQEAYKTPSIVGEYIRAGGTLKPLMEILDTCEKDKHNDIADVLHLIQLVMIQCLNYGETHAKYAAKSARAIMTNHQTVLCSLLQDQSEQALNCRSSALRLLRALLLVDGTSYWRDVLKLMDVSAPKMDMAACRESVVVPEGYIGASLRTVFIEFNLALLIDTPAEVVRSWLTRSSLIHPLVSNLVFDHSANVILVMRSLQKYVLGSTEIDKYIYRTVFTPDILKALVNVYEWVGPEKVATPADGKESVLNPVEEFVLPLLTSRRCFLVPKSFEIERNSPRYRQLLQVLKHTQLHDHQRRLVMGMLEMCPEVLPAVLETYGGLIKHEVNRPMLKSMLTLHKLDELIAGLQPGVSAKALSGFVVKSTLPRTMIEYIASALEADPENIHFCLEFLETMLTRCDEYLQTIERHRTLDQFGLKKIKVDTINHIIAVFPSIDRIMAAMEVHRNNRSIPTSSRTLESAMDILLVCIRTFPAYIESSAFITTYRNILRPVYRSPVVEHLFLNYEFKAIKVVIALEPQSVSFSSSLFPSVLKLLVKMYLNGKHVMRRDATLQLLALFRNTALFDNRGTEIEFWFQALTDVEPALVPDIVTFLAEEAKLAAEKVAKKSSSITPAEHMLIDEAFAVGAADRQVDLDELFVRVEQDAADDGLYTAGGASDAIDTQVELPVMDNFFMHIFSKSTMKPPRFGAYFDGVALRYLHYLPHPEIVERALNAGHPTSMVLKYIRQWLKGKECVLERDQWMHWQRMSKSFVAKNHDFTLDKQTLATRTKNYDTLHVFHQTLFFLSRLAMADKLSPTHMELLTHYSSMLLDHLVNEDYLVEWERKELLAGIFLQRPVLFENFTIITQKHVPVRGLLSEFMYELMQKLHRLPDFERYTVLYSNKIITELIRVSSSATEISLNGALVQKLLDIFKLNERHCVTLLRHYSQQSVNVFVSERQHTCHYQQLCFALEQLAVRNRRRQEYYLPEEAVRGLVRIYMQVDTGTEGIALEELEQALHNYFITFPHSVEYVEPELMRVFFDNGRRIGKPLVNLATYLLARSNRFNEPFLELVGQNASKKELVYPLLTVAFRNGIISETLLGEEYCKRLLAQVYAEYKGPILKLLEKPNKAAAIYRENEMASEQLIRLCMPRNECVDFGRKKLRIEGVEPFQLRVLMEIYGIALKTLDGGNAASQQTIFCNGFSVLLQCFEVLFRSISSAQYLLQQDVHVQRLNELVLAMYRWVKQATHYHGTLGATSFSTVTSSAQWNTFCKTCLKFGIDTPRCVDNERRYDERLHVLPKLMAMLVDLFYTNGVKEQSDIERYYDWALSHSNFLRVILLQHQYKPKTALVQLLYVLARKNPTVVNQKHVPILLGAYGATLTDCNRFLLALLQHYEHSGVQMHEFRPFLWGETAIKHFALEADANPVEGAPTEPAAEGAPRPVRASFRTNLSEVFSLLMADKMVNTVEQYPVWRKLDPCAQLPETNFDELAEHSRQGREALQVAYQPANAVERFVEKGRRSGTNSHHPPPELLEMHEVNTNVSPLMYDPAFLVPMLNYLYADEQADMLRQGVRSGLIALPFVCLSSADEQMRLAAAGVILRIRNHLELTRRFIDWKFWLHLFSSVQRGFVELRMADEKWSESKGKTKKGRVPRAPFISMIFIAETIKLLPNVLSKLHGPMTRYVLRQDVYNFRMVPNFLPMFNSNDVQHDVQRTFMLRTLYHGVRSHMDFAVLRASPIIHVMMGFHGSPLSNRELDMTILNLLSAMAKIPKSCEYLVDSLGFLGWLSERIDATESFHFDTIEALLGLLNNCWYSMQMMAYKRAARKHQQSYPRASVFSQRSLLILALKFLPLLSTRSTSNTLIRLLNLFEKTTSSWHGYQHLLSLVSAEVLQQLVEYFETVFNEHMWCVRYVRQCGSYASDDDVTMGNILLDAKVDQTTIRIVVALRRFIIRWYSFQKADSKTTTKEELEDVDDAMEVESSPDTDEESDEDNEEYRINDV